MDKEFNVDDLGFWQCEKCGTDGDYIEKTIGWYMDDEHIIAKYHVCPKCGYDWTAYLGEDGHIVSFDGWCDHTA